MKDLLRRRPLLLAVATGLLLVIALVALTVLEPGEDSVDAVVPDGARIVQRQRIDDANVLLVREGDRLQVVVAHKERGGWFATEVDPAPSTASAAWVATRGDGPVPALSAVYGRSVGTRVTVQWADGGSGEATSASGDPFLIVRAGHQRSQKVTMLGPDGAVVAEVTGP